MSVYFIYTHVNICIYLNVVEDERNVGKFIIVSNYLRLIKCIFKSILVYNGYKNTGGERMGKSKVMLGGAAVIAVMLVIMCISTYNGLVTSEENIDSQWAQVENQLQRRFDLIPNLVNTVEGYMEHEREIFENLASARAAYNSAGNVEEQAAANDALSETLSQLLVVVENYPTLKVDAQFTRLMDELAGTENRLAVARKDYNEAVQDYNEDVRRFPGSLMASMFGFEKRNYFDIEEGVAENPAVDFGGE